MKLSDKALRLIGRKLLDRTDSPHLQDNPPLPGKPVVPARGARASGRKRKAAVLAFKKRRR
jgi:hypothetical protein